MREEAAADDAVGAAAAREAERISKRRRRERARGTGQLARSMEAWLQSSKPLSVLEDEGIMDVVARAVDAVARAVVAEETELRAAAKRVDEAAAQRLRREQRKRKQEATPTIAKRVIPRLEGRLRLVQAARIQPGARSQAETAAARS